MPKTTSKNNTLVTYNNRFIKTVPLNKRRSAIFKCVGVCSVLGKIMKMSPKKFVFGYLDYGTSNTETFEILGFLNHGSRHMFFLGTEIDSSYRGSMITGGTLDYTTMEQQLFSEMGGERKRLCLYGTEIKNGDTVSFKKIMVFPDFDTPEELEMKILVSGDSEFLEKKNEWVKNHPAIKC